VTSEYLVDSFQSFSLIATGGALLLLSSSSRATTSVDYNPNNCSAGTQQRIVFTALDHGGDGWIPGNSFEIRNQRTNILILNGTLNGMVDTENFMKEFSVCLEIGDPYTVSFVSTVVDVSGGTTVWDEMGFEISSCHIYLSKYLQASTFSFSSLPLFSSAGNMSNVTLPVVDQICGQCNVSQFSLELILIGSLYGGVPYGWNGGTHYQLKRTGEEGEGYNGTLVTGLMRVHSYCLTSGVWSIEFLDAPLDDDFLTDDYYAKYFGVEEYQILVSNGVTQVAMAIGEMVTLNVVGATATMSVSTKSPTKTPTRLPTSRPTKAPTTPPTYRPSASMTPSRSPSRSPTSQPTLRPTLAPSLPPTSMPTMSPTSPPTSLPTLQPTVFPSSIPTCLLTQGPSSSPSSSSTPSPTSIPSLSPTRQPTTSPTCSPISQPTPLPTLSPSIIPSSMPTVSPIPPPSTPQPTLIPSYPPTLFPTPQLSLSPTDIPTPSSSSLPTPPPSLSPTPPPSLSPTPPPSLSPTPPPSLSPTPSPSLSPTPSSSSLPTPPPSLSPTPSPSLSSTPSPSLSPTPSPSLSLTHQPTASPTLPPTPLPIPPSLMVTAEPTSFPPPTLTPLPNSILPSSSPSSPVPSSPSVTPSISSGEVSSRASIQTPLRSYSVGPIPLLWAVVSLTAALATLSFFAIKIIQYRRLRVLVPDPLSPQQP
jgi:hypothetical protein